MRFRIIWDEYNGLYAGHRNSPSDVRPTEVEADFHSIIYDGNSYPVGLQFTKGEEDVPVMTLFQLPVAVTAVAEVS